MVVLLVKDFSPELNFEILNFVQCVPWPIMANMAEAKILGQQFENLDHPGITHCIVTDEMQ